jgi:Ion transport protein
LIYAILGVYLFAPIMPYYSEPNEEFHSNFQTVGAAFVTLIRTLTGEDWASLMESFSVGQGESIKYNCIANP